MYSTGTPPTLVAARHGAACGVGLGGRPNERNHAVLEPGTVVVPGERQESVFVAADVQVRQQ